MLLLLSHVSNLQGEVTIQWYLCWVMSLTFKERGPFNGTFAESWVQPWRRGDHSMIPLLSHVSNLQGEGPFNDTLAESYVQPSRRGTIQWYLCWVMSLTFKERGPFNLTPTESCVQPSIREGTIQWYPCWVMSLNFQERGPFHDTPAKSWVQTSRRGDHMIPLNKRGSLNDTPVKSWTKLHQKRTIQWYPHPGHCLYHSQKRGHSLISLLSNDSNISKIHMEQRQ